MSDSEGSLRSSQYLDAVTNYVLNKQDAAGSEESCTNISFAELQASSTLKYNTPCECASCRELRELSITKDTVYKVNFRLQKLSPDDGNFSALIVQKCRKFKVCGYIEFNQERTGASGMMEGDIKNINKVKDWLEGQQKYIESPLKENIDFSWFMIQRQPTKLEFDECIKPKDGKS